MPIASSISSASAPEPAFGSQIKALVDGFAAEPAWANYLHAREAVLRMMDDWSGLGPEQGPSAYWREEMKGFDYLFDASPLVIGRLREHCHHLTGVKSFDYRSHHAHVQADFVRKYGVLLAAGGEDLFVSEPPALGGFGFDVGPGLANIDTLKFFEVLIGLRKAGALQDFQSPDQPRRTVVEIGSGWGGFAHQFKTLFPNSAYLCVDLPPTLLFSIVYLKTLFPEARTLIYGEPGFEAKLGEMETYDFVFLPHWYFPRMAQVWIDLAINMVSFQEMTTGQVEGYARVLRGFGCPALYSLNRDRSKHNTELSTVSEALGRHYQLTQVDVLDEPYTQIAERKRPRELAVTGYRHLYGRA